MNSDIMVDNTYTGNVIPKLNNTGKSHKGIRSSRHIKMVVDMAMPRMILVSVCKIFGASKPIDILVLDLMQYHRHLGKF